MQIDTLHQFLEHGYIIVRDAVPPDKLPELRLSAELMVDRSKARSLAERGEDESRGGAWYARAQPRVDIDQVVDAETADIVDFLLGPTVHGVSHQIMGDCAIGTMQILCSGLVDYGYTDWHRDSSAREQTPLSGLQMDLMENRPGYVQWNIALYDDDVFWLVPGSHRQPSDEEQRRQLLKDPTSQLSGGIPIALKAGDGVVYPNVVLHWGSYYSTVLRRTLHLSFRSFGGDIFPYSHDLRWRQSMGFTQHLSEESRAHFAGSIELFNQERDEIESTFRALIDADEKRFEAQIAKLHPGESGRMTTVVLLCRIAEKVSLMHSSDIARLPTAERDRALDGPSDGSYYASIGSRFNPEEATTLQKRFATLTYRLEQDAARVHRRYRAIHAELRPDAVTPPNFESRPLRQFHSDMPDGFGLAEFVGSW